MSNFGVFEYPGRIDRAIYVGSKSLWCEFGRSNTQWPLVPATPPATGMVEQPATPLPNQADIDAPYLYVKASRVSLVVPISLTH